MVYAAVNGFHSETLAYEWDAPGLMAISPAAWWRVPGEDGIVLHSLSWAPLLLDYGAIGDHDTSTFDQWTLDGDYLYNNTQSIEPRPCRPGFRRIVSFELGTSRRTRHQQNPISHSNAISPGIFSNKASTAGFSIR